MHSHYTTLRAQIAQLRLQHQALVKCLENLQEQINVLEAEVRITIKNQADRIAELECLTAPYSQNGTPICNFSYETEI